MLTQQNVRFLVNFNTVFSSFIYALQQNNLLEQSENC